MSTSAWLALGLGAVFFTLADGAETEARKFYQEKSFTQAAGAWQKIMETEKPEEGTPRWRELTYHISDARWRALAAANNQDGTAYGPWIRALEELAQPPLPEAEAQPDRWYAEANVSLGGYQLRQSPQFYMFMSARPYYEKALAWWAGQDKSEEARLAYLGIVFKALSYLDNQSHYPQPPWPSAICDNAVELAKSNSEKADANFLLAMALWREGGARTPKTWQRTKEAFANALELGQGTDWHDDALLMAATWASQAGRLTEPTPGQYLPTPDYVEAARLYRQFLTSYGKGDSRWRDLAQRQLEEITTPRIEVHVSQGFLPGSLIEYGLQTRNVNEVTLTLRKLDLAKALDLNGHPSKDWNRELVPNRGLGESARTWKLDTKAELPHAPVGKSERTDSLPNGAYWLEATGNDGQTKAKGALVLVTNLVVSWIPTGTQRAMAFACDAITGLPVPEARVILFDYSEPSDRSQANRKLIVRKVEGLADADGIAMLDYPVPGSNEYEMGSTILARSGDEVALVQNQYGHDRRNSNDSEMYRAYVYTDRPAYRPGDIAHFKMILRTERNHVLATPASAKVRARIDDPRGEKRFEKEWVLDDYGTAHDSFEIPKDGALGEYRIVLERLASNGTQHIGSQTILRLEEYKLPEFRVEVKTPEENGKPVTFRLGDRVKAEIKATYYSGGPVPGAKVKVRIFQSPFYGGNPWPEPCPWLYQGLRSSSPWARHSEATWNRRNNEVLNQDTVTDAQGIAAVEFDTPPGGGQDLSYEVVAEVTDASRREITGSGSVKVTRHPFAIHARAESRVIVPGDSAKIEARALDPNGNPQEVAATLVVTREVWLRRIRKNKKTGAEAIIFQGYEPKEIERRDVKFDAEGQVRFSFRPPEEGYYRVRLVSPPFHPPSAQTSAAATEASGPPPPDRVIGETFVFAAKSDTRDLGYRFGALQIFPDKLTYKVGETAKVVVISPSDGGAALVSLAADTLLEHKLARFDGTAKFLEFAVTEAWQPNLFFNGLMIKDGKALVATEEVVVPPVQQFLDVEVDPGEADVKPGAKARYKIKVADAEGKPVRANLSLAVVDSSIFYIQPDLAGDIREFFSDRKRADLGNAISLLNQMALVNIRPPEPADEYEERIETQGYGGAMPAVGQERWDQSYGGLAKREGNVFAGQSMDERSSLASGYALNAPMLASAPASAGSMASRAVNEAEASSMRREAKEVFKNGALAGDAGGEGPSDTVIVRSDFRATAFWQASIMTDAQGEASAEFPYPETLTEWKGVVRTVTTGAQFGSGDSLARTRQPIMVRLQAPRFLVEGDRVTLSAIVNNETAKDANVAVELTAENLDPLGAGTKSVTVKPNGQGRADRDFIAKKARGDVTAAATAKASAGSDAMKLTFPLIEHGIEKLEARSLVLDSKDPKAPVSAEMMLTLPAQRNPAGTKLRVQLAPSLASTCLDALPYLADYPYGCVEQTLSRFVPAAIAAQTLRDLKLSPEAVADRIFGGLEAGSAKALKMKRGDLGKLDEMVQKGLGRLASMQHGDGGWGWWADDESDSFMSAYVLQGLSLARDAGVTIPSSLVSRGADFLRGQLVNFEEDPQMASWLLYALAISNTGWDSHCVKAADRAWNQRDQLNPYTRSLLALTYYRRAEASRQTEYRGRAETLVHNLADGAVLTDAASGLIGSAGSATMPVTAHWGEAGIHDRWSEGGVEATAFALRAYLEIDPDNERVDQAARWLINNRRGAQWKNTRDTAITILSLLRYMKVRGETAPDLAAEITVNGGKSQNEKFTSENALGVLNLDLPADVLKDGENKIQITATGPGRLYASAWLTYFTKETPIPAGGNEIYVKREYYRISTTPRLLGGFNTTRTLLADGAQLSSGDDVEVRLLIEAKNNYEYLLFEDRKPAGCEAAQVRSGEPLYARQRLADGRYEGETASVYQELRDQWVALFITRLDQGFYEVTYRLRAEIPGTFHALPTSGHAMYVPEIRCNGDEVRLTITDAD
jgi:hypothetical protein